MRPSIRFAAERPHRAPSKTHFVAPPLLSVIRAINHSFPKNFHLLFLAWHESRRWPSKSDRHTGHHHHRGHLAEIRTSAGTMFGWSMWVADAVEHDEHIPDEEMASGEQWKKFTGQLFGWKFLQKNFIKVFCIIAYVGAANLYGHIYDYTFFECVYFAVITVTSQGMGT